MTLSLSKKNVPSVMAMALTMVSLIAPADAYTKVFSQQIGRMMYSCHVDTNKNPLPDCLNTMARICDTRDPTWSSAKKAICQNGVNQMFGGMNSWWQNVRKECGQWPFTQNGKSYTGVYSSLKCATANEALTAFGYSFQYDLSRVYVTPITPSVTKAFSLYIWSNTVLTDNVYVANMGKRSLSSTVLSPPECSYVVTSWKNMGKTTSVDPTSATACCYRLGSSTQTSGIPGVTCTSAGIVTEINWASKSLSGSIPSSLGNLQNLVKLNLEFNELSGSVAQSLGDLSDLKLLDVGNNPSLSGTFRASCQTTDLFVTNTKIIVCGCLSASTPAIGLPSYETPSECLADGLDGSTGALKKRSQILSLLVYTTKIQSYIYNCRVDNNKNPMQDCLNSMAEICFRSPSDCKKAVDSMFGGMNSWWQNVRKQCGRWQWTDGVTRVYTSTSCDAANEDLKKNARYLFQKGGVSVSYAVDEGVTSSLNARLWGNQIYN